MPNEPIDLRKLDPGTFKLLQNESWPEGEGGPITVTVRFRPADEEEKVVVLEGGAGVVVSSVKEVPEGKTELGPAFRGPVGFYGQRIACTSALANLLLCAAGSGNLDGAVAQVVAQAPGLGPRITEAVLRGMLFRAQQDFRGGSGPPSSGTGDDGDG